MIASTVVTVMGGLGLIAEVDFPKTSFWGVDDTGWNPDPKVLALYWIKRNGERGKPISQSVIGRIEKWDSFWEASVVEQVSNDIAHERRLASQAS